MESKCVLLGDIAPSRRIWYARVMVIEKTPIRLTRLGYRQQKYVIADKENTKMQCIVYDQDVDQLDKVLELYHTYYIGHCRMRDANRSSTLVAESYYELVLNKSCYIRAAPDQYQLPLENVYDLTSFESAPEYSDDPKNRINVLCAAIHVFQPRNTKNGKRLQEFVVVNEEYKPMILTFWEDFLQTEAPKLTIDVHTMPIILAMRVSVNTFHGISLSTAINTSILFDPPIPEAERLRVWLEGNKDYVENVISDKLYEKDSQAIAQPSTSQIRKISQIISSAEVVKSFWIKACFCITKVEQQLYAMTCPNCAKMCGADYMNEFTCLHCTNDFPSPRPILHFEAELSDGTGSIEVVINRREAESLLGMSAEAIIESEQRDDKVDANRVNDMLRNTRSLYHVRGYNYAVRGEMFVRYTVMAWLPASDLSTAPEQSTSGSKCRASEAITDQACSSTSNKKTKHH